jgi:regulator of protease activity HflC (stomatin/prohibitin superfamily)
MFNYVKDGYLNVPKVVAHVVLAIIALILIFGSFGVVDAGERGVKTRLGNVVGIVEPGLYFKMPFIEAVRTMSVRTQSVIYERENPLASASSDLQDVSIASVTNYHVDPTKVVELYVQYKTLAAFEESVIRPAVRDTVKATASQYSAADLVTKRPEFASAVAAKLNERLSDTYVIVEQSNITDLQFSESFSAAIEAKVTAVQQAEAAKNQLETVKYEAQQTIEKAKAEAESIRIQTAAINSQGGANYVEKIIADKWNGQGCTSYCGLEASTGLLIQR